MDPSPLEAGRRVLRRGVRRAVGRGRLGAAVASARRRAGSGVPDAADVTLEPAGVEHREVLANLVQLYRHDLSEFRGFELSEAGTYEYAYLDDYLTARDREAWLVRAGGRLAGFVLIRRRADGVWQISEHFVARSWRGHGIGRAALAQALALHDGDWTFFVDDGNDASARMCSGAVLDVGAVGARASRGLSATGFVGTVYRFSVQARGDEGRAATADVGR